MRDSFDLRDDAGLPAVGDGNDLALAPAGLRFLRSPVVSNGVAMHIREGAIKAGSQANTGEQAAEAGDDENDPLDDTRTEGMLQVTMFDPAEKMLLRGDADATTNNETEGRQHEPIAPRMQGANEGPGKTCDDKRNDATEQYGGVQQKD